MAIKKQSLKEKAYEYIKNRIVQCELLPGCPLYEKELIAAIGVGRTPIREALLKLSEEQLVRIHSKRGIFVAEISMQDVIDVYTIREALEPTATRIATDNIDESIIEGFKSFWSDKTNLQSVTEHIKTDREFHRYIAESTRNRYFIQTLFLLYDQINRFRFFTLNQSSSRVDQACREHLIIIKKLMKRDAAGAEQAMKDHLKRAKETACMQFPNHPPIKLI